jgi:hypothetical protein
MLRFYGAAADFSKNKGKGKGENLPQIESASSSRTGASE